MYGPKFGKDVVMQHNDHGFSQGAEAPAPSVVRSFTLTGGRAVPKVDLGFEAVLRVRTTARHRMWPVGAKADIMAVCEGLSVAEVSARLSLPIGVARVLLADLVADGHLEVERTITGDSTLEERRDLLQRTLRGLRATG